MVSNIQVDAALKRIRILRTEKKYSEAYNALKDLIAIHPEHRVAKLLLVEIAMVLNLWAEAEAICGSSADGSGALAGSAGEPAAGARGLPSPPGPRSAARSSS